MKQKTVATKVAPSAINANGCTVTLKVGLYTEDIKSVQYLTCNRYAIKNGLVHLIAQNKKIIAVVPLANVDGIINVNVLKQK